VVAYDGFPIEVQLRTRSQHDWAVAVECVSRAIALEETRELVPEALYEELSRLRREALPFLSGGH